MKISYLLSSLGRSGGNMVLYSFMDELLKRNYEIYLILPYERIKWTKDTFKDITAGKYEFKAYKHLRYSFDYGLFRLLKRDKVNRLTKNLLKHWIQSDITIATYSLTAFAAFELMDRTLSIYHMQHYEELFFPDNEKLSKKARITYGLPINLIANSKWLAGQIKVKFGRESNLLNPGIDLSIFKPSQDPRAKYTNAKPLRILQYSDKRHFKGFSDGVKVMDYIKDKYGNRVEWILFGGYKAEGYNFDKHLGLVFKEKLAEEYSKAHIVFMPSWYESFPLPPLEAMACGTVPLCTEYGTEDYCNEKNSLVTKPRDVEKMIALLEEIIEQPEKGISLVEEGLKTVQNYTWEKRADELEAALKSIKENNCQNNFKDIKKFLEGTFK